MTIQKFAGMLNALATGDSRPWRHASPASQIEQLRNDPCSDPAVWASCLAAISPASFELKRLIAESAPGLDLNLDRVTRNLTMLIASGATVRAGIQSLQASLNLDPETFAYWKHWWDRGEEAPSAAIEVPIALVISGPDGKRGSLANLMLDFDENKPDLLIEHPAMALVPLGRALIETIQQAAHPGGRFVWRLKVHSLHYQGGALDGRSLGAAAEVAFRIAGTCLQYVRGALLLGGPGMQAVGGEALKLEAGAANQIHRVGIAMASSLNQDQIESLGPHCTVKSLASIEDAVEFVTVLPPAPGGPIAPGDNRYVTREADTQLLRHINDPQGRTVHLQGPRRCGKSSALNRLGPVAARLGYKVIRIDLREIHREAERSPDRFIFLFTNQIGHVGGVSEKLESLWDELLTSTENCRSFIVQHILRRHSRVCLIIDNAGAVLGAGYQEDFYGLLRDFHEARQQATFPEEPWFGWTLVMAYHESPSDFLADSTGSPFNVGEHILVPHFTKAQCRVLMARYSIQESKVDLDALVNLTGGIPFLFQLALHSIRTQGVTTATLAASAVTREGAFGPHLTAIRERLSAAGWNASHASSLGVLVQGSAFSSPPVPRPALSSFLRWFAPSQPKPTFTCELYRSVFHEYFK